MPDLPEHSSPKAARILAAAGELLGKHGSRGLTIADVATRAHVGKGTVYLYWRSKEDLLLGLISRDFIALADDVTAAVTTDPDLARPSRLCPNMLRMATEHPYVSALLHHDGALLGILTDDPRSGTLLDALGPYGVMHRILPIWRRNNLARTDWPLANQAYALDALVTGFVAAATGRHSQPPVTDSGKVLAAAVTALLGPEDASPDQVQATAEEGLRLLAEERATTLDLISRAALTSSSPSLPS
ncbi:helix-turn-helix domain-containing protein [Actinophytocola sp.]|uniref:TetR/AcrR family transcriptional regulator n=1 Tax=Actinophytocola sp. TaxID=1872138 RepID=UPI002ED3D6FA